MRRFLLMLAKPDLVNYPMGLGVTSDVIQTR
jgi:hypothetical protein